MYLFTGTTCATVLTQAILLEGCKSLAAGVNVMDLRSGINMAVDAVISDLKSRAVMISTPEEITQVSCCGLCDSLPTIPIYLSCVKNCLICFK